MHKRIFVLLFAAVLWVYGGAYVWAELSAAQKLAAGKQQFDAGNLDAARDNFIDVMVSGTPEESQEANQYINKIHDKIGNVTAPTFVPDAGVAAGSIPAAASDAASTSAQTAGGVNPALDTSYGSGPSYKGHILGEGADGSASGTDLGGTAGAASTDAQKDSSAAFVVTSLRQTAVQNLQNTKGVKVYFRNNDVDAIDIDSSVLFSTPSRFSANGRKILENIYTLMVLSPKPTFVILPPGSYTDDVKLTGVKNAVAMASYLIYRGISPAKLSYNMGLYNEEPPAKFSNLDGLSVVFDYDTPPMLRMPASGEKLPVMSMAIAPSSQAMYADSNGGMLIDYSVIETANPITDWTLQVIQKGADGKYYVVRQVEGSGPIYNQTFWNGRKNFYGDMLPSGTYTALLTATDGAGKTKSLSRKMQIVGRSAARTQYSLSGAGTAANYTASYLWSRPARTSVASDMPVPASSPAAQSDAGVSGGMQPYQPDNTAAAPAAPGADYASGYTAEDFAAAKGSAVGGAPTTAPTGGVQPYQPGAPGATTNAPRLPDNSGAGAAQAGDDYQYSYTTN